MTRRLAREESGIALVLALIVLIVLAALTAAVSFEVAVNHRNAGQSAAADRAFALAELGLSYAEGRVYSSASTHVTPSSSPTSFGQDGGTVTYYANVAPDGVTWTMTGIGSYGGVTRTVSAQADVPSKVTVTDYSVWNYLYSNDTTATCATTLEQGGGNGQAISVPLFVRGNLCMQQQSQFNGAQLEVGGTLTITQHSGNSNYAIGTPSNPISELDVAGAGASCNGATPGSGSCNGSTYPIYARTVKNTLSVALSMPPVDLANAYATADPGPVTTGNGCGPGSSGVPANFFDNDTTLNASDGNINLFPPTSYACYSSDGSSYIKWNASTHTLSVKGELYFDGNLSVSNGSSTEIDYTGQGTLYFTGTVAINSATTICGVAGCGTTWDPDVNGMIVIAGCEKMYNGTLTPVVYASGPFAGTYCMSINTTKTVQFGAYVTQDYLLQSGTDMGPVLANTLTFQSGASAIIPFHTMPPGTPLNTSTTYLPAVKPTNWNG